jgi:hypothetical protein
MANFFGFFKEKYRRLDLSKRFYMESSLQTIEHSQISSLKFYQFKAGTSKFFFEKCGKSDIRITDTPHFEFAKALHLGDSGAIEKAKDYYREYLLASWGTDSSADEIEKKIKNFRNHFKHIRSNGLDSMPVVTTLGADGALVVVDGNHRFSIACALGMGAKVRWIPMEVAFKKYVKIPGFFGIRNSQPYQSVYLNKNIIVEGRRNDLIKRIEMIPREAIEGKSVLDLACNAGMSSLIASRFGATRCLGLEVSTQLVDLASRFSMFEGAYPAVSFRTFDIDRESLGMDETYDTGFLFSIYRHLKNPAALNKLVERHVKSYVVFEGHTGDPKSYYQEFFSSGLFKSVDEIGRLDTSVIKKDQSRTLWLCSR